MRTCSCGWATSADGQPAPPADALPTDTFFNDSYKLSHFFNGEGVQLLHMPKANTDGDSIVYFRGSDVIALGDLMATESYPVFDVEKGGSINGIIDGLNAVLDLAITEFRLEGGTMMVPGHGRIVDSGDVAYYRDMLTIIRDRIQDMVTKEMTLDEVKAARPTADYDTEYGKTPGWTSDMFIEAVYKSLGGGRTPQRPPTRQAQINGVGSHLLRTLCASGSKARPALIVLVACRRHRLPFAQEAAAAVAAPTPRAAAPIDLTGYWVSLVTDDWRWRMVTPPKGDVLYLPVNDEGKRVAEAWDPAKDEAAGEACRAYGAGGIMHLPGRLHITWENDTTLKVETDTGQQTRLFAFGGTEPDGEATWQGSSAATWDLPGGRTRARPRWRCQQRIPLVPGHRFGSRPRTCVRATIAGTECLTARMRG